MDKTFLLTQLSEKLRATAEVTKNAASEARLDAKSGAARAVNLANAHTVRDQAARDALDALANFHPKPLRKGDRIGLGAVVEVEDGNEGRTLFLAPVLGGTELTGPDGDGIFHVVTPSSPFGRALMGKRDGDVVEVNLAGEITEWTITYVA